MSDEPIKPKRQRANKPALEATLDEASIEKAVEDEVFLTELEIRCVHLSRVSVENAANRLNWSIKEVKDCLRRPHVRLYALEYRQEFIKDMARDEARRTRKKGISPATIQERLMDIAMMPPAETKGSVDGQVKALQELAAHLGLKKDDPLAGKTTEELQEIVNGTRNAKAGKTPTVN